MFSETHKVISRNVCNDACQKYDLKLNEKSFTWGSALPDIHPKYRILSHYPDESLNYIVNEISYLIFAGRFIDFQNDVFYGISNKFFSRKLGIISHFLADFVCRPHYENWSFNEAMVKHVKYEKQMKKLATDFQFKPINIGRIEYEFDDKGSLSIKKIVKSFVENVLDEYSQETSMKRDLQFAYNFNKVVTEFVLETIILYNNEKKLVKAIVF